MRVAIHEGRPVHMKNRSVIDKRVLSDARVALRFRLKQQEDEPLQHQFGPPSCGSDAPSVIPRHLKDKFWEIMLKEGVVVRHPYGGYMHPRFAAVPQPSKEVAEKSIRDALTDSGILEK